MQTREAQNSRGGTWTSTTTFTSILDLSTVEVGDEVAIIGQALDGSVANDLMIVVGMLDFGGGDHLLAQRSGAIDGHLVAALADKPICRW